MVGPELKLEAIGGAPARRGHDAGVVHEQVDAVGPGMRPFGESPHRVEAGEVELGHLALRTRGKHLDGAPGLLTLGHVATRQHCSPPCELTRGHQTQAAVGAGHHGQASALIRNLISGPLDAPTVAG
jgi:hypothetical protein